MKWKKYLKKHWWKYILGIIIIFSTALPLYVLIEMSLKGADGSGIQINLAGLCVF